MDKVANQSITRFSVETVIGMFRGLAVTLELSLLTSVSDGLYL